MNQKEKYKLIRKEFVEYLENAWEVADYEQTEGGRWGFSIPNTFKNYFEVQYSSVCVCGNYYSNHPHYIEYKEIEDKLFLKLDEITKKYFN